MYSVRSMLFDALLIFFVPLRETMHPQLRREGTSIRNSGIST